MSYLSWPMIYAQNWGVMALRTFTLPILITSLRIVWYLIMPIVMLLLVGLHEEVC